MNSKKVIQKRNQIFASFVVIMIILVTAIILVAILVDDSNIRSLINILLIIVLLGTSLAYRNVLLGYTNMAKIAKVVLSQSKSLPFKHNPIKNPKILKQRGFQLYTFSDSYDIYYKIDIDKSLKVKSIRMLYLVLLLKNSDVDFYDKRMHVDIQKLESTFKKREIPSKYIITAFKPYNSIDNKALTDIAEVVCYQDKRQFYSQINVGLNDEDKKAYFLYSDTYSPTMYYKLGVDFIKDII
jgi:hypothetical protein